MTHDWPAHFRPEVVRHAFGGGKLSSYCIALEAWRRGLEVTFTDAALRNYRISDEQKTLHFNDSRPQTLTRHSDYSKLMSKSVAIDHLRAHGDRKSTRLNSSHVAISYAVFCLKKKIT